MRKALKKHSKGFKPQASSHIVRWAWLVVLAGILAFVLSRAINKQLLFSGFEQPSINLLTDDDQYQNRAVKKIKPSNANDNIITRRKAKEEQEGQVGVSPTQAPPPTPLSSSQVTALCQGSQNCIDTYAVQTNTGASIAVSEQIVKDNKEIIPGPPSTTTGSNVPPLTAAQITTLCQGSQTCIDTYVVSMRSGKSISQSEQYVKKLYSQNYTSSQIPCCVATENSDKCATIDGLGQSYIEYAGSVNKYSKCAAGQFSCSHYYTADGKLLTASACVGGRGGGGSPWSTPHKTPEEACKGANPNLNVAPAKTCSSSELYAEPGWYKKECKGFGCWVNLAIKTQCCTSAIEVKKTAKDICSDIPLKTTYVNPVIISEANAPTIEFNNGSLYIESMRLKSDGETGGISCQVGISTTCMDVFGEGIKDIKNNPIKLDHLACPIVDNNKLTTGTCCPDN